MQQVEAISNLLSRFKTAESENEISDQLIERQDMEIGYLKKYLKEAERMNDVLIEVICNNIVPKEECKQCIKEWARKKVEDE